MDCHVASLLAVTSRSAIPPRSQQCLRLIVLANAVDKSSPSGRADGAAQVRGVRACIEVIRGSLLLGWKLKFISHGALAELATLLEACGKQAARWEQWFERW